MRLVFVIVKAQSLLSKRQHQGDFYLYEEKSKHQVIKALETF